MRNKMVYFAEPIWFHFFFQKKPSTYELELVFFFWGLRSRWKSPVSKVIGCVFVLPLCLEIDRDRGFEMSDRTSRYMPYNELYVHFNSMSWRVCASWKLRTVLHGLMETSTIRGIVARCEINTSIGGRYTLRLSWSENQKHFSGEKLLKLCAKSVTAGQYLVNKRSSKLAAQYARTTSRNICSTGPYAQGE